LTRTPRIKPWTAVFRITVGALTVVSLSVGQVANAEDPAAGPQVATVYWGAYLNGAPFDLSTIDNFEAAAGKRMSIVHWGQPWVMGGALQSFQTHQYDVVRARGAIPMVDWGSWDVSKGATQPEFRLASVASGKYDGYIKGWAQAARAWGQPFFLRFDWEMNGWWQFPWAESINGNQWGDYVKAWRHVHDIFADQGATNATWVWCPNISSANTRSLASLYPGDNYVDWTCMDGYNFGTDKGNQWQSFAQVFGGSPYNANHNTYAELLAVAPSKPIMIGETASAERGGSKAAWISDMLNELPTNFPQIKALLWFNWNGGDPSVSWPVASSRAANDAFSIGIAASAYATNQFGASPNLQALRPIVAAPGLSAPVPAAVQTDPNQTNPAAVQSESAPEASAPPEMMQAGDAPEQAAQVDTVLDFAAPTGIDTPSAN
jgi:hypothetical protein